MKTFDLYAYRKKYLAKNKKVAKKVSAYNAKYLKAYRQTKKYKNSMKKYRQLHSDSHKAYMVQYRLRMKQAVNAIKKRK